jgi:hypothetical protein
MSKHSALINHIRQDGPETRTEHCHLSTRLAGHHRLLRESQPLLGASGLDDFGVELFEDGPGAGDSAMDPLSDEKDAKIVVNDPDAAADSVAAKIGEMFEDFFAQESAPGNSSASLPVPAGGGAPIESSLSQPMTVTPALASPSPAEKASAVVQRHPWRPIWSGLLGAFAGSGIVLALWLNTLKPTSSGGQIEQGPALGNEEPRHDEFATIRQALELARERKYAAAVNAIEAAPLPANEHWKSTSPLVINRHELLQHWRIEERLHAAGFLSAGFLSLIHHDPVAAVDHLLDDYRKAEDQLREARAQLAKVPKPVDTTPWLREIEHLRESNRLLEAEARQRHAAATELHNARVAADQSSARARTLEERLSLTEAKLRTAEERLKRTADSSTLSASSFAMPAKFPEPFDSTSPYQHYLRGLALYKQARYAEAENALRVAVRGDNQDARYEYFLGLACLAQDKNDEAAESFRRGAHLEQENRPSHVFVQVALESVRGETRRELDRYRTQPPAK